MTEWPGNPDEDIRFEDEADHQRDNDDMLVIGEHADLVSCWRCGKAVEATLSFCPYCKASFVPPSGPVAGKSGRARSESTPIVPLLWFYAGFLATSVAWGIFSSFGMNPGVQSADSIITRLVCLEAIDTILVIGACLLLSPGRSRWWWGMSRVPLAWIGGVVMLAAMLGVNLAYQALLKSVLHLPETGGALAPLKGYTALLIALVCVQPAIVEELFFRYLALGHLRSVMGVHAAIWLSALMFGLAHIGAPLSLPLLTLLGIFLGYARVSGGGLLLPMVMHFFHNLTVLYLDQTL